MADSAIQNFLMNELKNDENEKKSTTQKNNTKVIVFND